MSKEIRSLLIIDHMPQLLSNSLNNYSLFPVNGDSSSEEIDVNDLKELDSVLVSRFNISIVGDVINLVDKVKEKCPDLESKLEVTQY